MYSRSSYRLTKPGSFNNLKLVVDEIPIALPNEVTVSIKCIGLNFADVFTVLGLYKAAPKGAFIPGLEFSGEVIGVGSSVTTFREGDRVFGVTKFGAYTTRINIDSRYVALMPPTWSYAAGAAFPVQAFTAYYALVMLGNFQKGQSVLIHSAAGGVGLWANRIAKKIGGYTVGVVGDRAKFGRLKAEQYDGMVVRSPKFKSDVEEQLGGRRLDIALEATGGKYFTWSYDLLGSQGRLVAYGSAQFTPLGKRPNYLVLLWKYLFRPKIDSLSIITANKSVMAFNLIWLYENVHLFQKLTEEIDTLDLPAPFIGHTYSFDQLPAALQMLQSGMTTGKVIVTVGD